MVIYDTTRQKYTTRNEIRTKLKFEFVFVLIIKNTMSGRVVFKIRHEIDMI